MWFLQLTLCFQQSHIFVNHLRSYQIQNCGNDKQPKACNIGSGVEANHINLSERRTQGGWCVIWQSTWMCERSDGRPGIMFKYCICRWACPRNRVMHTNNQRKIVKHIYFLNIQKMPLSSIAEMIYTSVSWRIGFSLGSALSPKGHIRDYQNHCKHKFGTMCKLIKPMTTQWHHEQLDQ